MGKQLIYEEYREHVSCFAVRCKYSPTKHAQNLDTRTHPDSRMHARKTRTYRDNTKHIPMVIWVYEYCTHAMYLVNDAHGLCQTKTNLYVSYIYYICVVCINPTNYLLNVLIRFVYPDKQF